MAEFLDETGVSLRGWIATDDGGPETRVELTVEGASGTVAQHIEGRGESGNAMLDLSVSALACWRDANRVEVGWEPTTSPCTLVRPRFQIPSTLFVKEVGQSFSRSEGVAELLDETSVSLQEWIATKDD